MLANINDNYFIWFNPSSPRVRCSRRDWGNGKLGQRTFDKQWGVGGVGWYPGYCALHTNVLWEVFLGSQEATLRPWALEELMVRVPAGKLGNEEWVYRTSETHGFYCTLEFRQALPTIMEIIKQQVSSGKAIGRGLLVQPLFRKKQTDTHSERLSNSPKVTKQVRGRVKIWLKSPLFIFQPSCSGNDRSL